jgi:hypothetical protein
VNAAEVRQVRAWVGDEPGDVAVQQALDDTGSIHAAALIILKTRRANMVRQPGKLSVQGDASVDWTSNLAAINGQIGDLEQILGEGSSAVTVSRLTRTSGRSLACRSRLR